MTLARVLVADEHPPSRAGIRLALEGRGFEICAEASDAAGALAAALRERPDICLLDVRIPGGGIAAATAIIQRLADTRIVMLAASEDERDFFEALLAGASGYLLKDVDPARLPHALEGVLAGEAALPRWLTARLVEEFRSRGRGRRLFAGRERRADLTSREWQVLELLGDGLDTRAIAGRLVVSPVTVRRHVSSLLGKLRVADRAEAVRLLGEPQVR